MTNRLAPFFRSSISLVQVHIQHMILHPWPCTCMRLKTAHRRWLSWASIRVSDAQPWTFQAPLGRNTIKVCILTNGSITAARNACVSNWNTTEWSRSKMVCSTFLFWKKNNQQVFVWWECMHFYGLSKEQMSLRHALPACIGITGDYCSSRHVSSEAIVHLQLPD